MAATEINPTCFRARILRYQLDHAKEQVASLEKDLAELYAECSCGRQIIEAEKSGSPLVGECSECGRKLSEAISRDVDAELEGAFRVS